MMLKETVVPRDYQTNIAKVASEKSTLVVMPTGTGKTLIAVLVAIDRLEKYPESKIMLMAPTKPLVEQHAKSFLDSTYVEKHDVVVLSGRIVPEDRREFYKIAKIIIATPQTIENDLDNGVLRLDDFSLLVVDECHRSVKKYAYPAVAKKFMLQSKHPLILGLTASPGSSKEKIDEICQNLFIDTVEIRSDIDEDIEKYVQPIQKEDIYVELPLEFKKAKMFFEEALKEDVYWLKEKHYIPIYTPPKKMLLDLQKRIIGSFIRGNKNPAMFAAMTKVISAIKIRYMLELLETQGISYVHDYITGLENSKKRNDKIVVNDVRVREAKKIIDELYVRGIEHPKMEKIIEIIKQMLESKRNARIICFANYRATVDKINNQLKNIGISSEVLIGQTMKEGKGLSQQEQVEILGEFNTGAFNVLIASSIGEEGLSISDVDVVIFYDAVASEIRRIQRIGRTGRNAPGKVIFLITKDSIDQAYYFASIAKEKKMKNILYGMKKKGVTKRKQNLIDFTKGE